MTCIVAYTDSDVVWMGGDSAGTKCDSVHTMKHPKVFKKDQFLIGCCGDIRIGQLLQYKLRVEDQPDYYDTLEYMSTMFVDAVIRLFKDNLYSENEDGKEWGGDFLVGYDGRIFNIEANFAVFETGECYHAIGSGDREALAALHTIDAILPKLNIPTKIEIALKASAKFNSSVSSPFTIISSIDGEGDDE